MSGSRHAERPWPAARSEMAGMRLKRKENDNMSRTTDSLAARPLALAGIIAAAVLMVPPAVVGQANPERALLNRIPPTTLLPDASGSGSAGLLVELNGERALLARIPVPRERSPESADADVTPGWVDGESALLGSRASPAPSGNGSSGVGQMR
jgi:hypothetical protein